MKLDFSNLEQPKIIEQRSLDRSIVWPKMIVDIQKEDQRFQIRPIDHKDIHELSELYRNYCPYFLGSARQHLLEESFYSEQVSLLSNWDDDSHKKIYFFGVMEHVNKNRIVMGFGCQRDPYDLVIQNLAVILDPEYRKQNLGADYVKYSDNFWAQSGTDYVFGLLSTRHTYSQKMFLKAGARYGGFLPGVFRRTFDGKNYYRDTEAYMYKFYNNSEKYCRDIGSCLVTEEAASHIEELIKKIKME